MLEVALTLPMPILLKEEVRRNGRLPVFKKGPTRMLTQLTDQNWYDSIYGRLNFK